MTITNLTVVSESDDKNIITWERDGCLRQVVLDRHGIVRDGVLHRTLNEEDGGAVAQHVSKHNAFSQEFAPMVAAAISDAMLSGKFGNATYERRKSEIDERRKARASIASDMRKALFDEAVKMQEGGDRTTGTLLMEYRNSANDRQLYRLYEIVTEAGK